LASRSKPSPSLLRAFQQVGRDLFLQGLNTSHSGNLSVRMRECVWVTHRGAPLGRLAGRHLVPVDLADPGAAAPAASSELPVHLAVYRQEDAGAVVHAHPPAVVALSLRRDRIEPVDLEGACYFPTVEVIPSPAPHDPREAAVPIARALGSARIVVVRGHGTFSRGADLWEAFHWASALEHSCRILLLSFLRAP
jgi:L-fuculose-phosphate aldolase